MIRAFAERTLARQKPSGIAPSRLLAVRDRGALAWLTLLVGASFVLRLALSRTVSVPAVFTDELVYSELASSFSESGRLLIHNSGFSAWTYGPLYPILISPAYALTDSVQTAHAVIKVVNALLISLAAIPAYLLARPLLSQRTAVVAAGLTLLVPSAVYSTRIMTESAAYPAFLFAMVVMVATLVRPSVGRQLLALGAIVICVAIRAQMIVLLPALLTAFLLFAWIEGQDSRRPFTTRLRAFRLTWLMSGACLTALLTLRVVEEGSGILDIRNGLVDRLRPLRTPQWALNHVAELDLYVGVIPLAAFLLVGWLAIRRRLPPAIAPFAAASLSASFWLLLLAGLYGTQQRQLPHVFDRYVFYLVPLFVIALLFWIDQGLPRPRRATVAIAALAALMPLVLPFETLLNDREWGTSTSSVGLVPWAWATLLVGDGWALRALVFLFACALALVFLRVRAEAGSLLVRICAIVFILSSLIVSTSNVAISQRAREDAGRNRLDWVDAAVIPGGQVAIVWRGDRTRPRPQQTALREAEVFNRSIGPVYDLQDPLAIVRSADVAVRAGRLVDSIGAGVRAEYVLAHRSLEVKGRPVAHDPESGLVLYRVDGQVRIGRRGT